MKKLAPKKNTKNIKNAILSERVEKEIMEGKEYLAELQVQLEMCNYWGMQLYNLGEFIRISQIYISNVYMTDKLNTTGLRDIHEYLAKNKNLVIHNKTEEEKVVTWTRKLVVARKKDIECPPPPGTQRTASLQRF